MHLIRKDQLEMMVTRLVSITGLFLILTTAAVNIYSVSASSTITTLITEAFFSCNVVFWYKNPDGKLPKLAAELVQRAALLEVPVESLEFTASQLRFDRRRYVMRYSETRLVYLAFYPLGTRNIKQKIVELTHYYSPLCYNAHVFDGDSEAEIPAPINPSHDLVVTVVDVSAAHWGATGAKYFSKKDVELSFMIPSTLLLEYAGSEIRWVGAHRSFCEGYKLFCLEYLGSESNALSIPEFHYNSLMHYFKMQRRNLNQFPLLMDPSEETRDEGTVEAIMTWVRSGCPKRTLPDFISIRSLKPFCGIANKLNFSLLVLSDDDFDRRRRGQTAEVRESVALKTGGYYSTSCAGATQCPEEPTCELLLYGTNVNDSGAEYIDDIRKPFEGMAWLAIWLSVAAVAIAAYLLIHGKKAVDCGKVILMVVSPLVNQTGDDSDAKFRLLYSVWVLLITILSNAYLGALQSFQIAPKVQSVNISFHELLEQGYSFYALPFTAETMEANYLGEKSWYFKALLSQADFSDHRALATAMLPMPHENLTLEFLKLDKKAWMEDDSRLIVLKKVLTQVLRRNYEILEQKFMSVQTWTAFIVPHGDELIGLYKSMVDGGIIGYWKMEAVIWNQGQYESKLKAALNLTRSENSESEVGPSALTIQDSLLLESLFLLGTLLATACLAFIVEVFPVEITFKTFENLVVIF